MEKRVACWKRPWRHGSGLQTAPSLGAGPEALYAGCSPGTSWGPGGGLGLDTEIPFQVPHPPFVLPPALGAALLCLELVEACSVA